MKRIICTTAVVLALGTAAVMPSVALAQVSVNINIGDAPPPIRYEVIPAPRSGYLWAPGYWNWDGSRHVWSSGHWERSRPQYVYVQPEWHQEGESWRLDRGGWKHGKNHHRHDDEGGDGEHDRGNDHCPPGQAKKGNC